MCLLLPLAEAKFNGIVNYLVTTRNLIIFRVTPYNLFPTDLYFLSIGFLLGLLILLMCRRADGVPVRGMMLFLIYWAAMGMGVLYGMVSGQIAWLEDFRALMLPTLVIPSTVVLAEHVRINVVLNRMIRIAAVLAVLHAIGGGLYFVQGGFQSETSIMAVEWRGCYALLLYYCLAFARTVGSKQKTPLSLICLALGLVVPLHKPVLATFLAANVILVALAARTGRRFGNVKIGGILLTMAIIGIIGAIGVSVALSLGKGYGKEYLLNRIFKYNYRHHERDVTGGRMKLWAQSLGEFARSPAIGTGLGHRIVHATGGKTNVIPIHNLYIQLLFQLGLLGFVPIIAIAVTWLSRSHRSLAWESDREQYWPRLGIYAFVLAILVASGYGDALGVRAIGYTFWMAVALESWAHSRALTAMGR